MPTTCRRFLSGLIVSVLLVASAASVPANGGAQPAAAPEHIVIVEGMTFYESPTFGYVVAWSPSDVRWQVDTDESAGGEDQLVLTSDAGQVIFEGYEGDGGDPSACLTRSAREIRRLSGVSQFRKAVFQDDRGGDWQGDNPYRAVSDTRATDAYTLRFTDEQGQGTDLALLIDCRMLVPGSAVLLVTYLTTPEQFNDDSVGGQADNLMGGVALPRRSFERDPSGGLSAHDSYKEAQDHQHWPQAPQLMIDPAGDELGIVTFVGNNQQSHFLQVLIENSGDRRLDARRLPLVANNPYSESGSPIVAPSSVTVFSLPSARGTDTVLQPGDRAVVRLDFDPPLDYAMCGQWKLLYAPDGGQTSTIGTLGGCGGGGLRPWIRTGG
jgi:hypothetical protein